MANLTTISRPYAKAILELAKQNNTYQQWSEVLNFLAALADDPIGKKIFSNRAILAQEKADFICSLAPYKMFAEAKNLVDLLAKNKRLLILPALYSLFEAMRRKAQNITTVHLTLAEPTSVAFDLAENVNVVTEIDPTLLGGGIAKLGNRVIDASIIGRLIAMRDQLIQ